MEQGACALTAASRREARRLREGHTETWVPAEQQYALIGGARARVQLGHDVVQEAAKVRREQHLVLLAQRSVRVCVCA
jgi:hypothetical protein